MGRILHVAPARPGGLAHWVKVAAAVLAAAAAGVGVVRLGDPTPDPIPQAPAPATATAPAPAVPAAPVAVAAPVVAEATTAPACPIQSLQLALDGQPARTVCMDATLLQQSGSVRSYVVRAGDADGWNLQVDLVERAVHSVVLRARDGRSYQCAGSGCAGRAVVRGTSPGGVGTLALQNLRLAPARSAAAAATAGAGLAVIHASLRVPSDDQVPGLACTGPSATLSAANGTLHRFCGQGGAGVELADDGQRTYRFHDHEGRMLVIALDAQQRVMGVAWEGHACRGEACRGVSTSSVDPDDALAERSFHFGRTELVRGTGDPRADRPPETTIVLDGTLVMPEQ